MSTLTFDTHAVIKQLKQSGFSEAQSEAISETYKKVQESNLEQLSTKQDVQNLETSLRAEIQEVRSDIKLLKWMLGAILAGILSLVIKTFF